MLDSIDSCIVNGIIHVQYTAVDGRSTLISTGVQSSVHTRVVAAWSDVEKGCEVHVWPDNKAYGEPLFRTLITDISPPFSPEA